MKTVEIQQIAIENIEELPNLKDLLPEVDDLAKDRLEADIEADGIREPLSLANIDDKIIVIDGHNRLRIANKLGFKTVPAVFYDNITDQTTAEIWMVNNQLAKRNINTLDRVKMVLQLEPELKRQAKERQGGLVQDSAQAGKVIEKLAKLAGKSRDTISKVKRILNANSPALIAAADKTISINKASEILDEISEFPEYQWSERIEDLLLKHKTEEEALAASKPAKVKPENNREFSTGYVRVQDNVLFLALDKSYTGKDGNIKLSNSEDDTINKMLFAAGFYAKLAADLRTAAKLYKTPEPKAPKAPTAKQLEKAAKKMEKSKAALIKLNEKEKKDAEKAAKKVEREQKKIEREAKKAAKKPVEPKFETTLGDSIKLSVAPEPKAVATKKKTAVTKKPAAPKTAPAKKAATKKTGKK